MKNDVSRNVVRKTVEVISEWVRSDYVGCLVSVSSVVSLCCSWALFVVTGAFCWFVQGCVLGGWWVPWIVDVSLGVNGRGTVAVVMLASLIVGL